MKKKNNFKYSNKKFQFNLTAKQVSYINKALWCYAESESSYKSYRAKLSAKYARSLSMRFYFFLVEKVGYKNV